MMMWMNWKMLIFLDELCLQKHLLEVAVLMDCSSELELEN